MPDITSITINDGESTPVGHVFAPVVNTPNQTVLVDRDAGTSAGNKTMILGYSPANGARKTHRVSLRLNVPFEVYDSNTGRLNVEYTARYSGDVVLPDQMTAQDRLNMAAYIANMINHSIIQGYITGPDPMY